MSRTDAPALVYRYSNHTFTPIEGKVIREAAVTLTVNGEIWLTSMCTPTQLEALAVGFLYNEGFINSTKEIIDVRVCASGDNVDVWLNHAVQKPSQWRRTSGCSGGLTGTDQDSIQPVKSSGETFDPDFLLTSMDQLLHVQELYREVRGVHCSALSDGTQIRLQAEDIGRHNTLDKLAGLFLMSNPAWKPRVVLTTGRVSSEMLQKCARIGAGLLISRTSPTSTSIHLAEKMGITLIGYARRDQFLVYAHPERLLIPIQARPVQASFAAAD